jgi:hypothetical protein
MAMTLSNESTKTINIILFICHLILFKKCFRYILSFLILPLILNYNSNVGLNEEIIPSQSALLSANPQGVQELQERG